MAPLPKRQFVLGLEPAAVALFVTDPDRTPAPDLDALRSLFQLTRSEAQLVECLVRGLSLEEATVPLGLRRDTVRTRLKDVFQKTGCHRQAELVRMVLTSTLPSTT